MATEPVQLHRVQAHMGPLPALMLCCFHHKILTNFISEYAFCKLSHMKQWSMHVGRDVYNMHVYHFLIFICVQCLLCSMGREFPLYMGVQESQKNIGKCFTYMTKWECRLSGKADSPKRLHFPCEPELASRVERRQWYSKIYK